MKVTAFDRVSEAGIGVCVMSWPLGATMLSEPFPCARSGKGKIAVGLPAARVFVEPGMAPGIGLGMALTDWFDVATSG